MKAPRTHAKLSFLTGRPRIQTQWVSGPNERRRWVVFGAKLSVFLALPWITINGAPALLFDIPNRRYHAFGAVYWPQDFYMVGLVLAIAAMLLFATASVVGRVFCGHACPHTLLTTLFMAIDHAIEGDRPARLARDAKGGIDARRALKHGVWVLIAAYMGFTFTSYFVGVDALLRGDIGIAPAVTWLAISAVVYLFAGHLRDFICTTVCPYGRFQGAMQDAASQLVTYDTKRGEPRGKGAITIERGGCVDCGLCVAVCPMGIDIRNGPQYECITCARCIDACDSTMIKIHAPIGLIAYAAPEQVKVPYGRRMWYAAVLVALVGGLVMLVNTRPLIGISASRDRGVAITLPDGRASNLYALTLLNKDTRPHALTLTLAGIDGQLVVGENPIQLAAGESRRVNASVVLAAPTEVPVPFTFALSGGAFGCEARATFVAPVKRAQL